MWLSHGHPDHLNLESPLAFRDATLLIPAHRGGRISSDLSRAGFRVLDLQNGRWYPLTDRVRILCLADWNQDGALLIDPGGRCAVLNLNDGEPADAAAHEPREFGDDWSEPLQPADVTAPRSYFTKFEHLKGRFEFINLRVGGRDNFIGRAVRRPWESRSRSRASLMTAIG